MTETELDLLQELLTERILRLRLKNARYEPRDVLKEMLHSLREHFKKPFEITNEQFTEVVQASCVVLRHIS